MQNLIDEANAYFKAHAATYHAGSLADDTLSVYQDGRLVGSVKRDRDSAWFGSFFPTGDRAPSSIQIKSRLTLTEVLFELISDDHDDKIGAMPKMTVARLTKAGATCVLDGEKAFEAGMLFVVDNFTSGLMGPVAHLRDYRYGKDNHKGFQTWSVGADGYEVVG
jgi:hypothetical protein